MIKFIIDIIILLLSLSILVCLHELGHLLVAKKFNVYCSEYSIGMGPLLYKRKKEGQETQFSIRALPIGGYVAMAGEGSEDLEEFKDVPKERFLTNIKRWQRALIMVAGVTINFILSLFLFMASGLTSPILDENHRNLKVYDSNGTSEYLAYKEGLRGEDNIKTVRYLFKLQGEQEQQISFDVENGRDLYSAVYLFDLTTSEFYNNDLANPNSLNDTWQWTLITDEGKNVSFTIKPTEYVINNAFGNDEVKYIWDTSVVGVDFYTRNRNFKEGFDRASDEFITSLTSFKVLFQEGGWQNLGGVISVFQVSSYATDVGFYYYLYVWGYISLNLAIINLLPFPGLDGWHLVVCAFEGITRRDMPLKVKEIMSIVGMVLLFGLMIFVTALDFLRL